jgi:hypothetical protein
LADYKDPSENLRRKRARENAIEAYKDVNENSEDVF